MLHKSLVKTQCNTIIKDTKKKLEELEVGKDLIEDIIKALKSNFLRWYNQMVLQLEKVSKSDSSGIVTETLKAMKNVTYKKKQGGFTIASAGGKIGMDQVQITNLRELMTIYDEGAAGRYVDYVGKIKEAMVDIQDQLASNTLSLYDAKGRKKSIRNMAEIQTRYDLINEDLSKLKDKGTKFVVATAHANASERCSWWQGKIFKIDLDIATRKMGQYPGVKPTQTILGYIDGKPYYSLKQACENGFLSYNCQHRVIAYYKGVHVPKYNLIEIKKKRDITQKQRYLENKIRQQKSKQVLAISPEERKKAQLESKRLQAEYRSFCEVNNVPRYDWRCRVTEVERDVSPVFKNINSKENESAPKELSKDYAISKEIGAEKYYLKFSSDLNKKEAKLVEEETIRILHLRNKTNYESISLIDLETGRVLRGKKPKRELEVKASNEMYYFARDNNNYVIVHNHPNSTYPSASDLTNALNKWKTARSCFVACHDGTIWEYKIDPNKTQMFDKVSEKEYNNNAIRKAYSKLFDSNKTFEEVLMDEIAEKYGLIIRRF